MSARRSIWEVARRELVERSRSRVLRISLVLLLALSAGGAIAAARIGQSSPVDDVGLVGPRSVVLEPAVRAQGQAAGRHVRLHGVATEAAAVRAVRSGDLDVAVVDGRQLVVKESRSDQAVRLAEAAMARQAAVDRLRSLGLSDAHVRRALQPRQPPVVVLDPGSRAEDRNQGMLYVGMLVLFVALIGFGQTVASSVTEEKSSRVVEVLLTTLSPRRLLAGKVLGVGLMGLIMLLLTGGVALVAGRLAGGDGLPSAAPETIALVVLWFVLGYVFYSVAYAAVGALVSRREDLDTAMLPINIAIIGAWVLAMIALDSPDGTLARISAFLPPFAPMVVPARVVLGDMGALGLIATVVLSILATAGLIVLAARIYERAILRIGAPIRLGRVLARRSGATPRPFSDVALRLAAVALLLAGVLIGFDNPVAIVLVVMGLLLIALRQGRKPGVPNAR